MLIILFTIKHIQDSDEEEFKKLFFSDDLIFALLVEFRRHVFLSLSNKSVIAAMCLHFSVLVSLAELEQLRRGLSLLNFNSLVCSYPDILKKVFQPPECEITRDYVQDLLVAAFSPNGSNDRTTEEAIIMMWVRYLKYLE